VVRSSGAVRDPSSSAAHRRRHSARLLPSARRVRDDRAAELDRPHSGRTSASGNQLNAGFISHPDVFSAIVASVAAVAGVLSLAFAHSSTLVGVLVSGHHDARDRGHRRRARRVQRLARCMRGAAGQLAVNLGCLVVVGALTLAVLRLANPAGWLMSPTAEPAQP
jgi:hypothetical protein